MKDAKILAGEIRNTFVIITKLYYLVVVLL